MTDLAFWLCAGAGILLTLACEAVALLIAWLLARVFGDHENEEDQQDE